MFRQGSRRVRRIRCSVTYVNTLGLEGLKVSLRGCWHFRGSRSVCGVRYNKRRTNRSRAAKLARWLDTVMDIASQFSCSGRFGWRKIPTCANACPAIRKNRLPRTKCGWRRGQTAQCPSLLGTLPYPRTPNGTAQLCSKQPSVIST